MKAVLLDIEGTTTPIEFVYQTLFPFAKARIGDYIEKNFANLKSEITDLKLEHKIDSGSQVYRGNFDENSPESVSDYLRFLIEVDRKSTPLKSLQGKIWQHGYASGELKSVIFADVPPALERWLGEGKKIAIYSSGSVLAQKMIFRYSNLGDLSPFISAYFDTRLGHKRERQSYENIAEKIRNRPRDILFVSDSLEEIKAAHQAGLKVVLANRKGNAAVTEKHSYPVIQTFAQI